ncbi:MAG: PD-(D/E)XK nuclease family protein [Halanaeroarchaeum sp.]
MTFEAEDVVDRLQTTDFRAWYRERERRQNARAGSFSRNSPSPPPDPAVHRPHTLLTCHRKQRYREENAPGEEPKPAGLFWIGSQIEEELVLEYLSSLAPTDVYVGNSMWVDTAVETKGRDLRLRGVTDPVFATGDGTPLLPVEVKTKRSIADVEEPEPHHRAQLHAYLYGLSATRDVDLERGLLLYVGRDDFSTRTFDVPFDEGFWRDRILPWLLAQTRYRRETGLPPADPKRDWECDVCEFRRRCGRTDDPVDDAGFEAFVPGHRYPRGRVEAALAADEDRQLTPILAEAYPDLAADSPVGPWRCEACGAIVRFDAVEWEGGELPRCERCAHAGRFARLRGRIPSAVPVVERGDAE